MKYLMGRTLFVQEEILASEYSKISAKIQVGDFTYIDHV